MEVDYKNFGFTESEFKQLLNWVVYPLQKIGCEVFIFGSRVKKNYHPFSDVDLLFEKPGSFSQFEKLELSKIIETVENSNFPFKVELVDRSKLVASYAKEVDEHKVKL